MKIISFTQKAIKYTHKKLEIESDVVKQSLQFFKEMRISRKRPTKYFTCTRQYFQMNSNTLWAIVHSSWLQSFWCEIRNKSSFIAFDLKIFRFRSPLSIIFTSYWSLLLFCVRLPILIKLCLFSSMNLNHCKWHISKIIEKYN